MFKFEKNYCWCGGLTVIDYCDVLVIKYSVLNGPLRSLKYKYLFSVSLIFNKK